MSELVIDGLTIEEYSKFSGEAGVVRRKWEQSGGTLDVKDDMLTLLEKYNQDSALFMEDGELNYNMIGLSYEWTEAINKDADLMMKYNKISGEIAQQAMFGDTSANADINVEGINLDTYAKACGTVQGADEAAVPGMLSPLGIRDLDHWKQVQDGFTELMSDPANMAISIEYGKLYMQYAPAHAAATEQYTKDVIEESIEDQEDKDELEKDAVKEVMKMAMSGNAGQILSYLKETFPDDADDNDSLDWHLDKGCDLFAESDNKEGAKALLQIRYDLQEDVDESKEEWVEEEMDSLFA